MSKARPDRDGLGRIDQLARAVYHNDSPQDPVNRNSTGKNQEQWGTPTVRLPSRKPETLAKCQKFREKNGRSGVPLYLEEQVNNAEKNWPTPKAAAPSSTRKPGTGGKELAEEAKKNWPTPRASGQNDSARKLNKSGKRHAGDDLTTAAKNWATPEAQNHVGCQTRHGKTFPRLGSQVQNWPTPTSNAVTGGHTGMASSSSTRRNLEKTLGRAESLKLNSKLNPNWVEQLMGVPVGWTQLPIEWTDFASSETALSRQPQQKHGSN